MGILLMMLLSVFLNLLVIIANGSLTRTINITEPTLIPPATTINIKNDPTIRSILQDALILNQQDEVIMTDPPQFK